MTLDELAEFIRPEPEKVAILTQWLASHGIHHYSTVRTGDFIEIDAPISVIEQVRSMKRKSE
jgi:hypothetical protein